MNRTKLIAATIVLSLIGVPTLSFAKARGGSGGGFSSGSRSGSTGSSIGSRGSRTYDQNGAKPIQQSATPKPATAPQATAAGQAPATQPASQPSFLQRNPLLAGIAGGLAGSWLGHMLFGATESSAKTSEAGEPVGEATQATGASNSTGILLFLMLLGAGTLFYFLKVRRPAIPDFSGITRSSAVGESLLTEPSATTGLTSTVVSDVTAADKASFQQLLTDIQTAWSKQDLAGLRRFVTPEMLTYFSTALAENTSQDIENHVEDVVLGRAEVRESWTEDATQYATVSLHWSARDYTISLTKQRGEAGYLVEGNQEKPSESSEVWTFMRFQDGKWLLSAIQQVD
ncbi:MAG: TIM44-like domain-containing protein [Nitrospirae bacterium]|nr:TIM44-like domain-containing protein [Nitrospirota bacterium]